MIARLLETRAQRAVVLMRLAVGFIFLSEGIQKFLYPDAIGARRFAKIGIPPPEVMGPFVACVEIACGTLILIGLLTRLVAHDEAKFMESFETLTAVCNACHQREKVFFVQVQTASVRCSLVTVMASAAER